MSRARRLIENELDDLKAEMLQGGELKRYVLSGNVELSGRVTRDSHHYVHQRSTNVIIDYVELNFESEEANDRWRETLEKEANELEANLKKDVIGYNDAIYKDLEHGYDDENADEQVEGNILANEYVFDENGDRDDDGGFNYEQLEDSSKARARAWWREASAGDDDFAEFVINEWKEHLEKKGFMEPEISWSGFSSQGDGASFTCKYIDFKLLFSDYDPLNPSAGEVEPGAAGAGGPAA